MSKPPYDFICPEGLKIFVVVFWVVDEKNDQEQLRYHECHITDTPENAIALTRWGFEGVPLEIISVKAIWDSRIIIKRDGLKEHLKELATVEEKKWCKEE